MAFFRPPCLKDSPMSSNIKRPHCAACLRPLQTCICRWITTLPHAVEVVILQHPLEVANAKGSAHLLHLSLPGSILKVGESFAPAELAPLLAGKNTLLLYPDTADERSLGMAAAPAFDPAWLRQAASLRLVVLDGTWRKSRKMLYLNPLLQQLPRLPLRNTPPSHYLIRKAQAPHQLSTLEATCYALMQLEGETGRLQPLLDAFDGFVAQQLAYRTGAA
ncbi:DTW domain-containing protein YfiP [Oxalobacteraceae bacterium GrIS 1.11]